LASPRFSTPYFYRRIFICRIFILPKPLNVGYKAALRKPRCLVGQALVFQDNSNLNNELNWL
jgi:hypothetical protein